MRTLFPLLFSLLLLSISGTAEEIRDYTTAVKVGENGSLKIHEVIEYDFGSTQRHGIFRDIPSTVRLTPGSPPIDLGLSAFNVRMDKHSVPWKLEEVHSPDAGRMVRLKIGDPHQLVSGRHLYTIDYWAPRGIFPASTGTDEEAVRWNVLGTGWKVPVRHFRARFFLPPALSENNVTVLSYTGHYGSTGSKASKPHWHNRRIFTITAEDLAPGEDVTVEIIFPRGALGASGRVEKGSSSLRKLLYTLPLPVTLLYLGLLYLFARRNGAGDDPGSIAPRYLPPENLSILEAGLIIDRFADNKDLAPAILELGELGYLKIYNDNKHSSPVVMRTDKEPGEELTEDQRYLLEELLFKYGNSFNFGESSSTRAERIRGALDRLSRQLYDWAVREGYMRENPEKVRLKFLLVAALMALPVVGVILYDTYMVHGIEMVFQLFILGVFGSVGVGLLIKSIRNKRYTGIFFSLFWLGFILFGFLPTFKNMQLSDLLFGPPALLGLMGLGVWYFYRRVGPFTRKGVEAWREVAGYREFVSRVEKDRIRRLLKEYPDYLDRGLPYAVLFGFATQWSALYGALQIPPPDWYYGDLQDVDTFSRSVSSDIARMAEPPAGSTGGFSGGGGFAGGGGGGGGGGSW